MPTPRKTIGVHGFTYDPAHESTSPAALFFGWQEMLDREITGFGWYSAPPGVIPLLRAWAAGSWNRYRWAYRTLALKAASDLAATIAEAGEPVSIVCHSLGSRVALQACEMLPRRSMVSRILIMDGAELRCNLPAPNALAPMVLNVVNSCDRVLRDLGSRFSGTVGECIGQVGVADRRPRWRDVFIDDAATQKRALDKRGWNLEGNAPLDFEDHCTAYRHKGNWPLYRAFMDGDPLADFNFIQREPATSRLMPAA